MLPFLTIIVPVLNEANNLPRCLASVVGQEYPRDRLEVLIADGGSTDGSQALVASFERRLDLHVIDNSHKGEAEWGKAIALREARGDLVQFMDADMWLTSPRMLQALAKPLLEDAELAGAVAPYRFAPELSVWSRFLSFDEFQRDPLFQVLTPAIDTFVTEQRQGYEVCEFPTPRIPPIGGTTMYRRREINLARWGGHFRETDHPVYLVKRGRNRFAYVREVGWAHDHCRALGDLVRKRARNLRGLETSYLYTQDRRDYVWLDTSNRNEVKRVILWIIGTNLALPRLVEGIRDALRVSRWEPLLRPIVAIAVTDGLILSLLVSADGRQFVRRALRPKLLKP